MVETILESRKLLVIGAHEGVKSVHLDKLLPSLKKMGVPFVYVGWDRSSQLPARYSRAGIRFRMIFRGWGYANRALLFGLPLWMLRACLFLLRQKPDLIMAVDFDTGLPTALAGLWTRVPFIYNIRDNFAMRAALPAPLRPLITRLDRWIIGRASRVIVPDASRITETDEKLRRKFVIIDNGALDVPPPPAAGAPRPFTVYALGYLRKSRGIELLLDAARRIPDMRVLMAGYIYESEKLEERIKQTPNVDFRGALPVEEALQLCFESDVIFTFYAPDSEINRKAVSNKWSDAMMAGKPILINSEVLKSEWIAQEDIGYLCPYGDVDRLVQVLEHIRRNPAEAGRKGENGRRLFESGYSWAAAERRLRALLTEV